MFAHPIQYRFNFRILVYPNKISGYNIAAIEICSDHFMDTKSNSFFSINNCPCLTGIPSIFRWIYTMGVENSKKKKIFYVIKRILRIFVLDMPSNSGLKLGCMPIQFEDPWLILRPRDLYELRILLQEQHKDLTGCVNLR